MEPTHSTEQTQPLDGHKPATLDKDTAPVSVPPEPPLSQPKAPNQHPRRKWILLGALGVGLVVVAIFGLSLVAFCCHSCRNG